MQDYALPSCFPLCALNGCLDRKLQVGGELFAQHCQCFKLLRRLGVILDDLQTLQNEQKNGGNREGTGETATPPPPHTHNSHKSDVVGRRFYCLPTHTGQSSAMRMPEGSERIKVSSSSMSSGAKDRE